MEIAAWEVSIGVIEIHFSESLQRGKMDIFWALVALSCLSLGASLQKTNIYEG